MKIGDKVKVTVDLPTPEDELYGYIRIAKAGDIGTILRTPTEDSPKYIVQLNTCTMKLGSEILEPVADTQDIDGESSEYQTTPVVIEMYGLTSAPVFKEIGMGPMFDFNCIIPVSEGDNPKKYWGTPFNSNDTIILSENCVSFHVIGGIPYPIFEALSKMYPGQALYTAYYQPGTSRMITRIYGNGSILREMTDTPITHCYQPGTTVDRIITTLEALGDLNAIRQFKVYAEGGRGLKLAIDHENQSVYLIPYDTDTMMETFARRARGASREELKERLDPIVSSVPVPMGDIPQVDNYAHPDAKCVSDGDDDE